MKRFTSFTSFFSAVFFMKAALALTLPVRGEYRVTNGFWDCARQCYHLGDDIAGNAGDEILSIGYGRVVEVTTHRRECGNYGGRVLIEYGAAAGLDTTVVALYGHLGQDTNNPATDDIFVSVGDWVAEGQVIGRLGTREENGCFPPHLHLGIHRGAYLGYATECEGWTYAGYTAQVYQPSNPCYCAILDNWYDPSEFLGIEEPELRIVDGYVTPDTGHPMDTPFTWHLRADGGRGTPITAGVFVWNPFFQREYYFLMDYIEGTARPFEFEYSGQVLHAGEYGYRFQIRTCAESVEDATRRNGPITALAGNEEPEDPPESDPPPPPPPPPEPECTPQSEICDGEDNDCDGDVDEGNITMPCSSDCGSGVYVCDLGRWLPCTAPQPQPEVCDNIDNDCDHFIDDNIPRRPCSTACGGGTEECHNGEWRWCTARQPTPEQCNYRDDDCDGEVNEGLDCWSPPPPPACSPWDEICDGEDNDCDGSIDENDAGGNITSPCSTACGWGVHVCDLGRWLPCTAPEPQEEACDGIDNDCDNLIDDFLYRDCRTACGTGTEYCIAGEWRACTVREPEPEECNGMDDDCDGEVNEGLDCWDPPPPPPPPPPPAEDPLPAPVIVRPANGYLLEVPQGEDWRNWPITLQWQPVAGASTYEYFIVYASGSNSGSVAVEGQTGGTSYNFARPREDHGIVFQWQVRAVSSSGLPGEWTAPWVMGFLVRTGSG